MSTITSPPATLDTQFDELEAEIMEDIAAPAPIHRGKLPVPDDDEVSVSPKKSKAIKAKVVPAPAAEEETQVIPEGIETQEAVAEVEEETEAQEDEAEEDAYEGAEEARVLAENSAKVAVFSANVMEHFGGIDLVSRVEEKLAIRFTMATTVPNPRRLALLGYSAYGSSSQTFWRISENTFGEDKAYLFIEEIQERSSLNTAASNAELKPKVITRCEVFPSKPYEMMKHNLAVQGENITVQLYDKHEEMLKVMAMDTSRTNRAFESLATALKKSSKQQTLLIESAMHQQPHHQQLLLTQGEDEDSGSSAASSPKKKKGGRKATASASSAQDDMEGVTTDTQFVYGPVTYEEINKALAEPSGATFAQAMAERAMIYKHVAVVGVFNDELTERAPLLEQEFVERSKAERELMIQQSKDHIAALDAAIQLQLNGRAEEELPEDELNQYQMLVGQRTDTQQQMKKKIPEPNRAGEEPSFGWFIERGFRELDEATGKTVFVMIEDIKVAHKKYKQLAAELKSKDPENKKDKGKDAKKPISHHWRVHTFNLGHLIETVNIEQEDGTMAKSEPIITVDPILYLDPAVREQTLSDISQYHSLDIQCGTGYGYFRSLHLLAKSEYCPFAAEGERNTAAPLKYLINKYGDEFRKLVEPCEANDWAMRAAFQTQIGGLITNKDEMIDTNCKVFYVYSIIHVKPKIYSKPVVLNASCAPLDSKEDHRTPQRTQLLDPARFGAYNESFKIDTRYLVVRHDIGKDELSVIKFTKFEGTKKEIRVIKELNRGELNQVLMKQGVDIQDVANLVNKNRKSAEEERHGGALAKFKADPVKSFIDHHTFIYLAKYLKNGGTTMGKTKSPLDFNLKIEMEMLAYSEFRNDHWAGASQFDKMAGMNGSTIERIPTLLKLPIEDTITPMPEIAATVAPAPTTTSLPSKANQHLEELAKVHALTQTSKAPTKQAKTVAPPVAVVQQEEEEEDSMEITPAPAVAPAPAKGKGKVASPVPPTPSTPSTTLATKAKTPLVKPVLPLSKVAGKRKDVPEEPAQPEKVTKKSKIVSPPPVQVAAPKAKATPAAAAKKKK